MYEFWFAIFIELQKAKDEENYFKESFDKQLCNERTLKIQVCVWVPAQVWKVCYTLFFACYSCVTSVVKSNFLLPGCVELCKSIYYMIFFFFLSGCEQTGWGDEQEGEGAGRPTRHWHRGAQEGEGEQETAAGAESREGEIQHRHRKIPEPAGWNGGGQYAHTPRK